MARLILKSPYLKPGGIKSPGGYLKYIATREGVEMAEDTSRHLPATAEQQKQIKSLIKKHPQSKESHEYEDYLASPTRGNADAFLWNVCEEYQDGIHHIFTYHPGWGQRVKGYEDTVLQTVTEVLKNTTA